MKDNKLIKGYRLGVYTCLTIYGIFSLFLNIKFYTIFFCIISFAIFNLISDKIEEKWNSTKPRN